MLGRVLPGILALILLSACESRSCDELKDVSEIFSPAQTSAGLLMNYGKLVACRARSLPAAANSDAERKLVLIYDLYIKALSYKGWNSLFFILSVISSVLVILWPALGVIFKHREQDWPWLRSPILQATLTALAALSIAFYSQYKTKQTQTEDLMRLATFSRQPIDELSLKITAAIKTIDDGFDFRSLSENGEAKWPQADHASDASADHH